jgi:hypothetical protein
MQCADITTDSHQIDQLDEEIEIEFQNEMTPPKTPASPPGPPAPSPPLWSQQDFNFYTNLIQEQLTQLENIVMGPHIITVDGVQHLRPYTGQNWRDRLNQLLFETRIPFFWILRCVPEEDDEEFDNDSSEYSEYEPDNDCPQRVHIYLISHDVETQVHHILENHLKNEYDNIVYLT